MYALLAAVNIFRFFRPFVERAPLDARKRFDPSKIIPHGFSKLHFATSSKGWEVVKRIEFAEDYFGGDLQSRFDTVQVIVNLFSNLQSNLWILLKWPSKAEQHCCLFWVPTQC